MQLLYGRTLINIIVCLQLKLYQMKENTEQRLVGICAQ